ncbi:zona pellucida sperm-binding protein 3-like [Clupea harengus]|uniref:Zona pellucida sperm-binding protein 3 n=1 Tax=Clupea harengus TaxID=7950 RepID=A0A6P3W6G2_CLUHA|nr:zona pellucida sperm-binding protein 3-like [Clupea harengus]
MVANMHFKLMKQLFTLNITISLTFVAVVVDCHSSKAKSLFVPFSELEKGDERYFEAKEKSNTYGDEKTISVHCTESAMDIKIKADFFGTGVPVDVDHLALLGKVPVDKTCRAFVSEDGYYKIVAPLTGCGTRFLVTEDALAYSNILVHFPSPSPEGLWRTVPVAVSVTCFYRRRYSASSNILRPTWAPYSYTQAMEDSLDFSLKLMADDWHRERTSGIFYLGDVINVEAAIDVTNHAPLRLYVNTCVATLKPDVNTVPKYTFIENQGCLTDAQQTGSSSQFLPRLRDDQLRFQLDSFVFFHMDPHPMYITCYLEAVPTEHWAPVDPEKKACSFIDGQWRSAEGFDEVCVSCGHAMVPDEGEGKMKQEKMETSSQEDWRKNAALGPFIVLSKGVMSNNSQ